MGQKIKQAEPFFVSFIVLTAATFLMRAYENYFSDNNMFSWALFFLALGMGIVTLANLIVINASQAPVRDNKGADDR